MRNVIATGEPTQREKGLEIYRCGIRSVEQRTPIAAAEVPRYDPEHRFVPPEEQVRGRGGRGRSGDRWNEEEKEAVPVSLVDHLYRMGLYAVFSFCAILL